VTKLQFIRKTKLFLLHRHTKTCVMWTSFDKNNTLVKNTNMMHVTREKT